MLGSHGLHGENDARSRHEGVLSQPHRCGAVDLAGLVHVAAVNQLHTRLALGGVVLLVVMAAIEKGGHWMVLEASSGPRSMA